jgi:hypothetical protein
LTARLPASADLASGLAQGMPLFVDWPSDKARVLV